GEQRGEQSSLVEAGAVTADRGEAAAGAVAASVAAGSFVGAGRLFTAGGSAGEDVFDRGLPLEHLAAAARRTPLASVTVSIAGAVPGAVSAGRLLRVYGLLLCGSEFRLHRPLRNELRRPIPAQRPRCDLWRR